MVSRWSALAILAAVACRGDGRSTPGPGDPPAGARPPADARVRSPHPVTPALLDAIAAIAVPEAEVVVLVRGATDLALAITASDRTRALVTVSACLGCVALDLSAWQARRPELAMLWAPGAEAEPSTTEAQLAITALPLGGGERAILIAARRADGTAVTVAHWNDGATQLQAVCEQPAAGCTPVIRAALAAAIAPLR